MQVGTDQTYARQFKELANLTPSEELVYRLCTKSFLSLWSYPNPQGKSRKELCDILIVCDPDIVIVSVKEIQLDETDKTSTSLKRWRKKAINESCKQIYGAARWLKNATHVITSAGEKGLALPDFDTRKIHYLAVALGGKGKTPIYYGDFGKGFVHVLDEISLDVVMGELDTIEDFVKYLSDKEALYEKGVFTLFDGGGEEDLLAFYLHQGRTFPDGPDFFVLDDNLWVNLTRRPEFIARKKADENSYFWDRLIELLASDLRSKRRISEFPGASTELSDIERILRVMARENRFHRRLLSDYVLQFLEASKIRSRSVPSPSGVLYVFLTTKSGVHRDDRLVELAARCWVARDLRRDSMTVVGLATEDPASANGFSLDVYYLHKHDWTCEDQEQARILREEYGYFANPNKTRMMGDEFPGTG